MFDVLCTASDVHWRQHITVCTSVLGTSLQECTMGELTEVGFLLLLAQSSRDHGW